MTGLISPVVGVVESSASPFATAAINSSPTTPLGLSSQSWCCRPCGGHICGKAPKSVPKAVSGASPQARLMIKQGPLALVLRLNTVRTSSVPIDSPGRRNSTLTGLMPTIASIAKRYVSLRADQVPKTRFVNENAPSHRHERKSLLRSRQRHAADVLTNQSSPLRTRAPDKPSLMSRRRCGWPPKADKPRWPQRSELPG